MTIERVKVEYVQSRGNVYNVPEKQWRKWDVAARQVFNEVYSSMTKGQWLFLHPKQEKISKSHWRTTAWNAAWTSAEAAERAGV